VKRSYSSVGTAFNLVWGKAGGNFLVGRVLDHLGVAMAPDFISNYGNSLCARRV